jgi:putative endonuclease
MMAVAWYEISMNPHELGRLGEQQAAAFLKKKRLKIVAQNVRLPRGELDIVAQDQDCLVFVEVKTIRSNQHFSPIDHFDHKKQKKLRQLAQAYSVRLPQEMDQRVDLILVEYHDPTWKIEHLENVLP